MSDDLFPNHDGTSSKPISLWNLPPTSVQQNGEVKMWSLDANDLPFEARGRINTREWPNEPITKSLQEVLEQGPFHPRFYMSPKACKGILSRAEKRGKTLPEGLAVHLRAAASRA